MKKAFVWVVLAILLAILAFAQEKSESPVQAVKAADIQFAKVVATKDLEASLNFYADDAVVMEPGMPVFKGKQAIRKSLEDFFALKDYMIHWTPEAVEVAESGDLAYTLGIFEAKYTDSMGKPVSEHGKYATIWKKTGNEWKVVVDINNTDGEGK